MKNSKKNLQDLKIQESTREVYFFDESRFGTHSKIGHGWFPTGSRAPVRIKLGFQNFYLYSAVNPKNGHDLTLILPNVNTECLNVFLKKLSDELGDRSIILVMDGAGWHYSKGLNVPKNIEIIYLPPYSPELNPIERLWLFIKQNTIKNRIYETLQELENSICDFINLKLSPEVLKSVCRVEFL